MGGDRVPSFMDLMECEECGEKFRRGGSKRTRDGRHRCPRCFGVNTKPVGFDVEVGPGD